jgi:hypothetical protein
MKNILLMLLLANILYYVWGQYIEEETQPGVDVVGASDFGPPMDVTSGRDGDTIASVGAVLGSGQMSALNAVVGRSCVTIGPFIDRADADSAALEYSNEGMRAMLRETRGKIFVGHWVWIRGIEDEAMGQEIMTQLIDGGLGDAYVDRTDSEGLKISLGLFGEVEGAEKIELQALSLGLPAETIPSTRPSDVFFVDIGLSPGKGAGAMIDRYGEDRVLLRGEATCPQ